MDRRPSQGAWCKESSRRALHGNRGGVSFASDARTRAPHSGRRGGWIVFHAGDRDRITTASALSANAHRQRNRVQPEEPAGHANTKTGEGCLAEAAKLRRRTESSLRCTTPPPVPS